MELHALTALQLGEKIQAGEVSPVEATQAALDRVRREQSRNNAFITVLGDAALSEARETEKRLRAGARLSPLAGVPMGLKDNICTKGIKTSCASKILGDFAPPYDATLVQRLRTAGGVLLGKLNMDEFAMGSTSETSFYGPVRNPWDLTRVPGGSSGGAAAAVAAGECWYAVGSDTGGSIRQPAAYCGVTGMKPTYGTVSRYGLVAYASSLDQIGPLCRDAADCAAVLDMLQGRDQRDGTSLDFDCGHLLENLSADLTGMKIGIPMDCFGEGLDPEVRESVLGVAEVLKGRGAQVEEFQLPIMEYVVPTYYILASAEASSNLGRFDGVRYGHRAQNYTDLLDMIKKSRDEGFGPEPKRRILIGTYVLSHGYYDAYYIKAQQVRRLIAEEFDHIFAENCDVIAAPVSTDAAFRFDDKSDPLSLYLSDLYTVPGSLAGLPSMSVPCGMSPDNLPFGLQLIAPKCKEARLLRTAHAYQNVTDWHKAVPAGY